MSGEAVLTLRPEGLHCEAGRFFIDPWRAVDRAIITHAHSDHARFGSARYLATHQTLPLLRARLGEEIDAQGLEYGESLRLGDAQVSLHPAGHIFGSAMVRVEVGGKVWVVSGDYKTEVDGTCAPWEPVRCHGFVTETTFGLPLYRWQPQAVIMDEIRDWWQTNRQAGRSTVLCAYALGKAQRLLAGLAERGIPIAVHGAVANMNRACAEGGLQLPPYRSVAEILEESAKPDWSQFVILCPPSATQSPWIKRFGDASVGFASGWMAVRGIRRRRNYDRGFVLSDHVDWESLMNSVKLSEAEEVWTTHGYAHQVAKYLTERGLSAKPLETEFSTEDGDDA